MLHGKTILFGVAMFSAGMVVAWLMYGNPQVAQAINVKGGETITTDGTTATFKVFLNDVTTVMTDAATVNAKPLCSRRFSASLRELFFAHGESVQTFMQNLRRIHAD